jgi:hypothetical protein
MIIEDSYSQIEKKRESLAMLSNPGSAYLKIMQYYQEEKIWNTLNQNTTENWEKFLSQYFSENAEMTIKIFEKENSYSEIRKLNFLFLDTTSDNMPLVYFHKNKNVLNKWLFIDNYFESFENDALSVYKTISIKNSLNVLEYKKTKIFIYFDGFCKFNSEFKFQTVSVVINNIEILDVTNTTKINVVELKNKLFSLYSNFKNFMNVILLSVIHYIGDLHANL